MVATLSTFVGLSLRTLRGSLFGDFGSEELITCVALLNREIKACGTGRLHMAKQVAHSKLLGISLNHAACGTNVDNATLDEQSSRAEKNVTQLLLILSSRHG